MSILAPDTDISLIARRDKNATQALPAVIALCANDACEYGEMRHEMFARKSYNIADAMERNRSRGSDPITAGEMCGHCKGGTDENVTHCPVCEGSGIEPT